MTDETHQLLRQLIRVTGMVQGVGFRPFIYRLATELGLTGFVLNSDGIVVIEVEGPQHRLDEFVDLISRHPPPLASIQTLEVQKLNCLGSVGFEISASVSSKSFDGRNSSADAGRTSIHISPDIATCADCLRELFEPSDRRYLYPFINCTNCGPRLTIIQQAPYDRQRTTMSGFAMCEHCRAEYHDPSNRRFDAQPIACPECGPQLRLLNTHGDLISVSDPLLEFANAIRSGQIGALKGLGGFHLVCNARSEQAVGTLRRLKHRDEKPLAIMVRDIEQARKLCCISQSEEQLLTSRQAPIVLLRRLTLPQTQLAEGIAPGNPELGLLLPYTPLHHILMHSLDDMPVVMTSGNQSDEPIVYRDEELIGRLGRVANLILTHYRPIQTRCDDSIVRVVAGQPTLVRRARGFAPEPIALPRRLPVPVLAVGGQLKSTFALGHGSTALISQHLGDLDHYAAWQAFEHSLELFESTWDIQPRLIVHDLHPDYVSTQYALQRAIRNQLQVLAVQHHHAHIASVVAEYQLAGPVIGVAFDGSGYGTDGTIWGGEFLVVDGATFQRVGHLAPISLPGGEAAIRAPWKVAAAYLQAAGVNRTVSFPGVTASAQNLVQQLLQRPSQSPLTSSMGRLFDAVAALIGVRTEITYEGQAAIELEWQARRGTCNKAYSFEIHEQFSSNTSACRMISPLPMIQEIVDDLGNLPIPEIARRFHVTVSRMIVTVCRTIRETTGLDQVALSGGVFLNSLLVELVQEQLLREGFACYLPRAVPAHDGGLSLGQLAVAAAWFQGE